ncbi:urea amidolyase associated protein UAAP1 [Alcanivorax sp. 1008]|uniref:urea amidolyase associated protein UAAP1 n=1 Tax=Alcanivorax sp. 1008 TaxID=2816853 RepID=UPI001D94759E|nr:urea amidolyase associated protein UAAP1 [Alcanivorax sp. 1008]MCC1495641.1 urea carboxylase-associated family protein [Alcanivorax sp. 1008]
MNNEMLYEDVIPGGCHWSFRVGRGQVLRLVDEHGGTNVGMLMYNAEQLLERINIPDTLKCQHTFRLGAGHCIYTDMGRVLCSITEDTAGWHDGVCGTCDSQLVESRWGRKTYQQAGNAMHRSGRDGFLIELAKHGLGRRDIVANLNLFSKVVADAEGNLTLAEGCSAGSHIDLRFEMDTLVVMHTCPHPLNLCAEWPARPVRYQIYQAMPLSDTDICRDSCDENQRGFLNNMHYHHGHCHHHGGGR